MPPNRATRRKLQRQHRGSAQLAPPPLPHQVTIRVPSWEPIITRDGIVERETHRLLLLTGEHPPTARAIDLAANPAALAQHMIDLLDYLARHAERNDDAGSLARWDILRIWRAWSDKKEPRKNDTAPAVTFARTVFDIAGRYPDRLDDTRLAMHVVVTFAVGYPELAVDLDLGLVQEALRRALADARRDKGPTKWRAIAAAYRTTGDPITEGGLEAACREAGVGT